MKQSKPKPGKSRPTARPGGTADRAAPKPTRDDIERRLDEELAETFPASDPPSILRGRPSDD